ncbi:MAG: GHKL domain-containing protein [Desulfobacterales bacterium]|nr:GHKL domain-containing protein [Desulfobacterales bacterium]
MTNDKCPSASSSERMLLRKLTDHYCGLYLIRILEGLIHNLNGPLQILCIRAEQLEQDLQELRDALLSAPACPGTADRPNAQAEQSEALTEVEGLAGRMQKKVKSISKSVDNLDVQLRHLTGNLIFERRSEIGNVKINEVIKDCLFLLNGDMFFKHNVKKTFRFDDALPVIRGRKTDFCIIILNLVRNALEAMVDAQDKHLAVETTSQEGKVIIRIQDTGCGIPAKDRERIYRPLFTTKKGAGHQSEHDEYAGLGLSLVSLLIEDYNGTIACESIHGKTTFTVEIPRL